MRHHSSLPMLLPPRAALLAIAFLSPASWAQGMDGGMAPGLSDSTARTEASLRGLVEQALRDNPGIHAAASRVKALHASPGQAWYLDPPQIGIEFHQAPVRSFPNPLKNQMEVDYTLQQTFPFPGKIRPRIEVEHRNAEMSEADLVALKRRVAREVKVAYYELHLLDRRLEINRESRILMGRFIEVARRQYEVGLGRQADILRAQGEATRLKGDSIALVQARQATGAMLNALLARKTDAPLPAALAIAPAETDWTLAQIASLLERNHPGLLAMKSAIRMREAEIKLAKREYLPDIMVGGAYKNTLEAPPGAHDGGLQDYWSVMASMNLPIAFWSRPKYKAGVIRGEAGLAQAEQEYADLRNRALARAQEALLKAQGSRELLRLSRDVLLPQSQQALESSQSAYQGGKTEFMALLDAYRMRLSAREESETALARLLASQADLEEAVGLGLEDIARMIKQGAGK